MNLRCTYCQTPFTIGRLEKLAAIQRMQAENLHHYDVFCPRCRRANSVSRQRLEIFTPGWQEGLKTLETEAARIEQERPPLPAQSGVTTVAAPVEATRNRHASRPAPAAPSRADTKPTASKPAAKAVSKAKSTSKPISKSTSKSTSKPASKSTSKSTSSPKRKPAAKAVSKTKPAAKKVTRKK